jgi:O-antigen/teichoic acid export membrane protein
VIFVGVSLNVEWIAQIFLRQAAYREALYLVPILLFGKLFFGIYTHLTVWFKLTDKTTYGIWFSAIGALITVVGNLSLIPLIGYTGSAISSMLCYMVMAWLCYRLGQRYFPVPYPLKKIGFQILLAVLLISGFYLFPFSSAAWMYTTSIGLTLAYIAVLVMTEKARLKHNA